MTDSMMSNQSLTLKTAIVPTSLWAGSTFQIYETWIVLSKASVVFRNKVQKERWQLDIATDGTCTIIKRWLTQWQTKVEDVNLRKERANGAEGYITVLASDLIDLDNEGWVQKPKWDYEYTWNIQTDALLESVWQFKASGKSRPQPSLASEAIRDVLYPSPVDWDSCRIGGNLCQFNGTTQQREYFGISTPLPQSSESVQGKIQLATDAEALAWTENTKAITSKKTNDIVNNKANFMIASDYPLWDTIADITKSILFKETAPTFAQATTIQSIWDLADNTRISFPTIGTGIAGNSLKLALAKVSSPTAFLRVRIETDVNWNTSWTLFDVNATKDIDPAGLTTSLADTTVLMWTNVVNAHWVTLNVNETSQTNYKWVKYTLTWQVGAVSVDKVAACTATKAYLYDLAGNLLKSGSFSWNIATLNYGWLVNGTSYYIMVGSDGSSYTSVKQTGASAYPYTAGRLNYVGGSNNQLNISTPQIDFNSNQSAANSFYITFTPTLNSIITTVNTVWWNYTTCVIQDNLWTQIYTSTYSSNIANFWWVSLVWWTTYRLYFSWGSFISNFYHLVAWISNWITFGDVGYNQMWISSMVFNTFSNITTTTDINNITSISTNDTILIPSGQKVHTVVSAVWDVVNASNYYKIGYSTNDTTTRIYRKYNWTSWNTQIVQSDNFYWTITNTSYWNVSWIWWVSQNESLLIWNTYWDVSWYLQTLQTYSWDIYTSAILNGHSGWYYSYHVWWAAIQLYKDANNYVNLSYNNHNSYWEDVGLTIVEWWVTTYSASVAWTWWIPYKILKTWNTVTFAKYIWWVWVSIWWSWTFTQTWFTVRTVLFVSTQNFSWFQGNASLDDFYLSNQNYTKLYPILSWSGFPYISSILFHDTVLSLTNSDFSYKIAINWIASALWAIGTYPKLIVYWLCNNFANMVEWATQYLWATPWSISSSAWTNSVTVGKARNATKLWVKDLLV